MRWFVFWDSNRLTSSTANSPLPVHRSLAVTSWNTLLSLVNAHQGTWIWPLFWIPDSFRATPLSRLHSLTRFNGRSPLGRTVELSVALNVPFIYVTLNFPNVNVTRSQPNQHLLVVTDCPFLSSATIQPISQSTIADPRTSSRKSHSQGKSKKNFIL